MPAVVGVRFKRAGKIYYFDPLELDLSVNDLVVVETSRGGEIGRVVIARKEVLENELSEPLKPVLRQATEADQRQMDSFHQREHEALTKCRERIQRHNLPMNLIEAEYSFDGSRLTFFFSAEERVDFRELVRELAGIFRTRIELRQVGVRDEAKILGGLGRCGRGLCCATFLTNFSPVSIKMAKEQDLPLNPMKISGMCGRLLCCLSHENDFYCRVKHAMPKYGEEVITPCGRGRVVGSNVLKECVHVQMETDAVVDVPIEDVRREGDQPPPPPTAKKPRRRSRKKGRSGTAQPEAATTPLAPTGAPPNGHDSEKIGGGK
ncbi:MAG: stage 0 sporulation protein [Chloroflexota bacterium]|nr:MAG: stage 0 sporulation protein [Chloroflexota bacterium]